MNDKWDDRLCTGNKCLATEWAQDMAVPKVKAPLIPRPPASPPPPPAPPAPQTTPAASAPVEIPAHLPTLRSLVQGAGLPEAGHGDAAEPEEDVEIDAVGACPAALTVAGKDIEGPGVPHEAQEEERLSQAKANFSFDTVAYLCN